MKAALRRIVVLTVASLALFGLFATTAHASWLEDVPVPTLGTSMTNPGAGADYWWRQGWGNSLHPQFKLTPPGGTWSVGDDGYLLGTYYVVDQTPTTVVDTITPDAAYRDSFGTTLDRLGTNTDTTLDMLGIYMNPPAGGWPAPQPGSTSPLEGQWYYHYSFYSSVRAQNGQWDVPFGIDLTPPRAVTGLRLRTGLSTSNVTTWTPATRCLISWDASETDDLSGDGYFQVLLDDRPYVPETSSNPVQGRVYSQPLLGWPSSFTIESMPPGKHKVSIQPVDRATNPGPATSAYFYSDPDTPTVSWLSPVGNTLSNNMLFSVNATDLAGDPTVDFYFDGVATKTITAAPYTYAPDLSGVPSGNHTLSVTVTDHLGRTATISKTVGWSNTAQTSGFMIANPPVLTAVAPLSSKSNPLSDSWHVDTRVSPPMAWGNSLNPDFTLPISTEASNFPINDMGSLSGMLYDVRRSPELIDASTPANYFRSVVPQVGTITTHLDKTLDLNSLISFPPAGGWPAPDPGTTLPVEGTWYLQYKAFTDAGWAESDTNYVKFGVDITPPTAVSGLSASPTTDTAGGTVTPNSRMNVAWLTGNYDQLSGVSYYVVSLDGSRIVPDGSDSQGRVVDIPGRAQPQVTVENLTPGKHTISVQAVDRAGNVGPASSVVVYSDPDVPQISWKAPYGDVLIPARHLISVNTTDLGGDPSVSFAIDGTGISTLTAAPYEITPDLSALSNGAHTLSATITDRMGRPTTISRVVTWNSAGIAVIDPAMDVSGVAGTSDDGTPNSTMTATANWTNNLTPVVRLAAPSGASDVFYNLSQTPSSLSVSNLNSYSHSVRPDGTEFDQSIDLKDMIDFPSAPWAPRMAGASNGYEGLWYFQWAWYDQDTLGASSKTYRMPFMVDLTAPAAVTGFAATPAADVWTSSQRAQLTWDAKSYDGLSGNLKYVIYLDDAPKMSISATSPMAGTATIENMPAGKHKLSISVFDRAGNESPRASISFESDPDVPTISWTAPTGTTLTNTSHTLSVNAADQAGDPVVTMAIDGSTVATISAPPYTVTPDLSALSPGSHVISATAQDMLGRQVTISKTVLWAPAGKVVDPTLDVLGLGAKAPDGTAGNVSGPYAHWTNNLMPLVTLLPPPEATDVFYQLTQSPSAIDTSTLTDNWHAARPDGTYFDQLVNLRDMIGFSPAPWNPGPLGASNQYEGLWYFQWTWYNSNTQGVSANTYRMPFLVDITPPTAVTGLKSNPAAGTWTSNARVVLSWDAKEYDALSGDASYQVFVDDAPKFSVSATSVVGNSLTIENMPGGRHKLSVAAVDRAGNVGPLNDLYIQCDPDVPTISWIAPKGSTLTPKNNLISVNASDSAGDPNVAFSLSGGILGSLKLPIGTALSSPFQITPDLTSLPNGDYVLSATATDKMGRTATISKNVTWDASSTMTPDESLNIPVGGVLGRSTTNPNDPSDPNAWWRQGWGNSLRPQISFTSPSPSVETTGLVVGMLYDVTTAANDIDPDLPDDYFRAARGTGTNFDQTFDLQGIYNYAPAGGWRPMLYPGATSMIEGPWFVNAVWFTSKGFVSSATAHGTIGIDLTPPARVESFTVSPTTDPADAVNVIPTTRINLAWKAKQYDALSGVGYFQILVDGSKAIPQGTDNPDQGRVYDIPGTTPSSVAIENLPAGKHVISIEAVDRATNVGEPVSVTVYSDPDTPTVGITSPTGAVVGVGPTVAANVADKGGVQSVVFKLDGVQILSKTAAPYSGKVDLSAFGSGTHTLTATVTDMYGRQATDSRTVTLDKTPLVLSSISTSSYHRNVSVRFTVSRAATVKLYLKYANVTKTIAATKAGTYTFTYTYARKSSRYPSPISFYDPFTLSASDSIGNSTSTSGRVKPTLARIVRLSRNRVKIVYY